STAVLLEEPSYAIAVRCAVVEPVKMKTIDCPLAHPLRFTSSCTMFLRFGVRCLGPAPSATAQESGDQFTAAEVRDRELMLLVAIAKVGGLSAAWPWMT